MSEQLIPLDNEEIVLRLYRFLTDDYYLDRRSSLIFAEPNYVLNQIHRLVMALNINECRLQKVEFSPQPGGSADEL